MALQQSGNLFAEGLPFTAQDRTHQPPYAQVDDDPAASTGTSVTDRR